MSTFGSKFIIQTVSVFESVGTSLDSGTCTLAVGGTQVSPNISQQFSSLTVPASGNSWFHPAGGQGREAAPAHCLQLHHCPCNRIPCHLPTAGRHCSRFTCLASARLHHHLLPGLLPWPGHPPLRPHGGAVASLHKKHHQRPILHLQPRLPLPHSQVLHLHLSRNQPVRSILALYWRRPLWSSFCGNLCARDERSESTRN